MDTVGFPPYVKTLSLSHNQISVIDPQISNMRYLHTLTVSTVHLNAKFELTLHI